MTPRKQKKTRHGVFHTKDLSSKVKPPQYQNFKQKSATPSLKDNSIRLNRYIANAGICSRREADKLIIAGEIKINGNVITELGYKVQPNDKVIYKNKVLKKEKNVYVLLNKPKDHITTAKDPQKRTTVLDLVNKHIGERIYPVGRLDRNTTGLLLLTNDGDLTKKLSHPSYNIKKIYEVHIDKPLRNEDYLSLCKEIVLDDGPIKLDDIAIISEDKKVIGIEIHSGRNRIVRRIFAAFNYKIVSLDRVMYAFLTKKNLPRGKWRFLKEHEVTKLKQLGFGKKKNKRS